MAIKIAISNHKGGVGKTTTTLNVGAGLALKKKKVLLIDLDAQANLSQCLGLGIEEQEATIYGAMTGKQPLKPIELKKNLYCVPSCLDFAGIELEIASRIGRERILHKLLHAVDEQFDYILVDCPPALGLVTVNAFTAVDKVYIPLQAEYLAMNGMDKLIQVMNMVKDDLNEKIVIDGIIITQYDNRKILNKEVQETVREIYGEKVFKTVIRDNVALAEAPSQMKDIFEYDKKSQGAEDYMSLVEEILAREKKVINEMKKHK
jgi:chromosome partitioning protein